MLTRQHHIFFHDVNDHHAEIAEHRSRAVRVAVSPRIMSLAIDFQCCRRFFLRSTSGEHSQDWSRVVWGVLEATPILSLWQIPVQSDCLRGDAAVTI